MLNINAIFHRTLTVDAWVGKVSNASFQHLLVRGDTGPKLQFNLLDEEGQIISVSGGVDFFLRPAGVSGGHVNVGHEACSGVNPGEGQWVYNLAEGDLARSGTYWGDVRVAFDDGRVETAFEAVRLYVRDNNQ